MLSDGRRAYEVAVGWDPPTASYYVVVGSNRDPDKPPLRRGFLGELPTFPDLMVELEELAAARAIHWPPDPVLIDVLLDDQARNLSTNDQDWHEVERRKGLLI